MYRFLIVVLVMFNSSLMHAMFPHLPLPPYYTDRTIQKTEAAAVFGIISERYPDLNLKNYKYHFGRHGWNQNIFIDFISNNNGKMVYSFDYNSDTKELIKQNF